MQDGILKSVDIRRLPWDDIGIDTSTQTDIAAVLSTANLDYENELIKIYDKDGIELKGNFAITRSDKPGIAYGFVKNRYVLPQNKTEFEFIDKYVKRSGGQYGHAGTLWDGELVWFFVKTDDVLIIAEQQIRIYILFMIYQDGKHSKQAKIIAIRENCNNVLIANSNAAPNNIGIPNLRNFTADIENLEAIDDMKDKYIKMIRIEFQKMFERKVTTKEQKTFFNKVVTGSMDVVTSNLSGTFANKIANMTDFYLNHPTQELITGTAFGLYNAVAGYYMNIKEYTSKEKRFGNIFIGGDSYISTEHAFRLAKQLTQVNS